MHVLIVQDGEGYDELVMAREAIADAICTVNKDFYADMDRVYIVQPESVIVILDRVNQASFQDEVQIHIKAL